MIMKNLITHWIKAITLFTLLLPATIANSQNFTLSVQNVSQTAPNKLDFDVYLLNTNAAQPFELASIQLGFLLNSLTYTGGTLTAAINNTGSGLVVAQQFAALGTNNVSSTLTGYPNETLIRVPGRSPAGSGFGTIISAVAPGTLVTHFTLTSTVNFTAGSTPNLSFTSTSSLSPLYASVITEYIATVNTQLTVTSGTNAIVNGNPSLNSGPAAFNVTGNGAYCQLTSGLPVGLAGSETGVTYTLYKNAITTGSTVVGTGLAISFGNQLFGTYTVSGTGTSGTTTMTGSAVLTETPAPSATISYTGSPFCTTNSALQPVTLTGTSGGTYSSTTGLTIDAATGAITPSTSTPGIYTVTYTVPASGGCSIYTTTTSVTIIAGPAATISYGGTPFCTSVSTPQAVTFTGTNNGTFTASPAGLSINALSGAITPSLSTPGNYTVTYTIAASGGCSIVTATASAIITAAPTATISYAGSPFCKSVSAPQGVTLTGAANGTYSASPAGLTIDPATGAITPSASTAGIYTVTYTIPAAGGCAVVTSTTSVTITTAPTASISYAGAPFCISNATAQSVTLTGTSGGTYSAPAGLAINAVTGAITPSTSTAGTYLVTYTIAASGGCAVVTATSSVIIDPVPVGGTVTGGSTPIILGQSTGTLTLAGYSGTIVKWQERLGTGAWIDLAFTTNTLNDIPNAVGVWEYHAVIGNGSCGSVNSSSVFITVNPSSAGTVTGGTTPICLGSSTGIMTLSGYTGTIVNWEKRVNAASTWTSIVNTAATYQEVPSSSGTWDYRAVTNNSSLLYSAPATIFVSAVSVGGSIASAQTICSGTAPVDLVLSGNVGSVIKWQHASDAGFTSPVDIAVTSNTLLGSTIGNLTTNTYFRAVVQNSICSTANSAAVLITVTPVPTATISYTGTPFCTSLVAGQSVTFSGTVGGIYTASPTGLMINSSTGAITPSTSTPGNYTVTYTVAASGGCNVVSTTTSVAITAAPTALISYSGNPFCISIATDQAVTLNGSLNGTFSAPAGLTINAATGAINPATSTAGTYLVTYTIPAAGGCLAVIATSSVTIQPASIGGSVSGGTTICSGTPSGLLTLSGNNGIIMKWQSTVSPFNTWTDIANTLSTYTSGPLTQTTQFRAVVQSGICSVANSSVTTVIVDPILAAPTATATLQPTCSVSTGTITVTAPSGVGMTYSIDGINYLNTNGIFTLLNSGSYSVTAKSATGCVSPFTTVTINPVPSIPSTPIVGTIIQTSCATNSGSVSLSGLPATGNWTINPGSLVGSGASTTITNVIPGTYNFTVTNSSGCTSSATANVVINVQPATPIAPVVGAITQPTCALATGSVILSGLPTGNWTIMPGNVTGSTPTTTITGLAAGTYNFTVANSTCTSLPSTNVVINVQPATPIAPVVGTITQPTCALATGSVILSGLPTGSWTIMPGNVTGSTPTTTITGLAAGTYNFTVANSTCTSPASVNVVITAQPSAPSAPVLGTVTQPTCAVSTGTINVNVVTGETYSIDNTNYSASGVFNLVVPGTYPVTAKNASGCVSPATSVTINAQQSAPTAPVVSTITQPTCATATGSVLLSGLPSGSWTINPGNITGTTTTTTISNLAAGNTYNYTVTNATGCISPASANIVIISQPTPPTAPVVGTITQPTCALATGSVVLSGLPSGNWTINPGAVTGAGSSTILSGLIAGTTYNFTVTNSLGCISSASTSVVFTTQPTDPTWIGAVNSDWNNPANWCSGVVPAVTNNLIISNNGTPITITAATGTVVCNNLTIEPGAVLIIAPDGSLTVNGTLTNNQISGIILQSDASRTGSLIVNAVAGTGTTVAQRYMTTGAWHMVSCPINGESVANFISGNSHIATRTDGVSRGLMDYDPANNKWNLFFTDGLANGNVGSGKGFAIHTNVSDIVTFNGSLQAGPQTITGLIAGSWNCVGNPYSSTIGINSNSSATANFLNENGINATNLDPNYGVIYIWDQPDASNGQPGKYTIISNTPLDNGYDVQQGQGFFVKMNSGATSLTFNRNMQIHNPTLGFKATKAVWPIIKLHATAGGQTSTTYLAFNNAMHKGLDPTYDAGLLKESADIAVYSHLVDGNTGIPFAIQASPDNESGMLIPIGLDYNTGGQVVFSADLVNIPSDCKVILEDLVARTITDISKANYTVTVDPKTSITDRFRLYTSKAISGVDQGSLVGKLFAYADRNVEIRVIGNVSKNTVATLYDIYGRVVLVKTLEEGSVNIIPLKNNKIGAYVLSVNDNGKISGFKILVRE